MKTPFDRLFRKRRRADAAPAMEAAHIQEKRDMIEGIEELSATTVKEIMVPRIDVAFLAEELSLPEVLRTVTECGHSRFPVYAQTIDNVVGILYAKDLLRWLHNGGKELDLRNLIRKSYFVPESMRLDSLLREMKRRRVHIAIVVDEYGGVSGIVSMEDIIEEIIGDIQDEFDNERDDIVKLGDGVLLSDARASIDDLNEVLGAELPADDFDTLGGFVFDLFGKIPSRYEKVAWNNLDFIIQDMDGHKIKTVKIVRRPDGEGDGDD
jgi:CBS domain containing-hemolysin-like protein